MYSRIILIFALCLWSVYLPAETIYQTSRFSALGEPKYPEDFQHFAYVNPDAPKGGNITLSAIGTFDNFNRYAMRGYPVARSDNLWDSLFINSDDEAGSLYPLIATSARHSDDFRWMEVTLNPRARFHDHSPITAQDVEFSFNKFMTEGVPMFRFSYKGTTVKALSSDKVRIELAKPNREDMLGLLGLPIFPRSFWQHHRLDEPLTIPPLGSGPYRISDYKLGQYIVYQRVKDYWAADLPVNRGQYNFDTLRYDYYLDDNVAMQAFRSGAYDVRSEDSPKNWATQYQGKNFTRGYIIKREMADLSPPNTNWLAFNITRPLFADRRVRQAITLAFDFEWLNKAFFYNSYQRTRSYFQNTVYEAKNLPDAAELYWLNPLKGQIPDEVFTQIYQPPTTTGNGDIRANLVKAAELLQQAGWEIRQQKLVNRSTGRPFRFELMLFSGRDAPYVLPLQHNLARLGIQMDIRQVDSAQYSKRLRDRDFDMMPRTYAALPYPRATALQLSWASDYVNSTYNSPGVQDKAIDSLLQQITAHQGQATPLLSLGRALDRVLTWHEYMLPMYSSQLIRLAYWNKFAMPAIRPIFTLGFDTWWFDGEKAARLPAQRR